MDDGFQVAFFGCDEGEAFLQIKAHLAAKNTVGSCSGSIFFFCAVFQHVSHEV